MISHKHKCIFVHIPKAAGTSIENAFIEDLGIDMFNKHALLLGRNTNRTIGPRRVSHLLAKEYVQLHFISQELFDNYFKFSFVRNPYERLYSIYKYNKFNDYISFDTFIKFKLENFIFSEKTGYFFKTQYDYLFNSNECLVDFIGKFENLESDFCKLLNELNLTHLSLCHLNKSLPSKGVKRNLRIIGKIIKDYKMWKYIIIRKSDRTLSSESKKIVAKYYKIDFETFNYNL